MALVLGVTSASARYHIRGDGIHDGYRFLRWLNDAKRGGNGERGRAVLFKCEKQGKGIGETMKETGMNFASAICFIFAVGMALVALGIFLGVLHPEPGKEVFGFWGAIGISILCLVGMMSIKSE